MGKNSKTFSVIQKYTIIFNKWFWKNKLKVHPFILSLLLIQSWDEYHGDYCTWEVWGRSQKLGFWLCPPQNRRSNSIHQLYSPSKLDLIIIYKVWFILHNENIRFGILFLKSNRTYVLLQHKVSLNSGLHGYVYRYSSYSNGNREYLTEEICRVLWRGHPTMVT